MNNFVLEVTSRTELTIEDIDKWKNEVVLPRGLTKLRKTFFHDRIVKRRGAHIRAFAAEVLTAVVILGFFVDIVLAEVALAKPELQPYVDCFALLRILLNIFERGNIKDIDTARDAMHSHHVLFAKLYPSSMKQKIHGQIHIIDFWVHWGALLSCFGPERHHLIMKKCMSFSYNKAHLTALAYDVRLWVNNLQLPDLFEPIHLAGTIRIVDREISWLPEGMRVRAWSGSLQTVAGMISKRDLIQWGRDASLGFAIGFAQTTSAAIPYLAFVHPCELHRPGYYKKLASVVAVNGHAVVGAVPYSTHDDLIAALIHVSS